MFLYEKEKEEIYVYGLNLNSEKTTSYKKSELQNFDTHFFVAEADAKSPNKVLENNDEINFRDLNIKNSSINSMFIRSGIVAYDNKFHSFRKDTVNKSILDNFYLGIYDNTRIVTVYKKIMPQFTDELLDMNSFNGYCMEGIINNREISNEKQIIHYLLITGTYELERLSSHVVMKNIISIPKSLYLLLLLNKGKLNKIGDENIDQQLSLFDFSIYPISIIPIEHLEKAFKYGLIDGNMDDINQKLEDSQKILKILRKLK